MREGIGQPIQTIYRNEGRDRSTGSVTFDCQCMESWRAG